MIPRTLVPKDARGPLVDVATTRRRPTSLDERTLVPSTLPIVALDGHSTIPSNLPLESIATRVVVPRDVNVEEVQRPDKSNLPPQPTEMDERVTIPQGVVAPAEFPAFLPVSEDLVEPDILQTGELAFLPPTRQQKASIGELIAALTSLALNLGFIVLLVFILSSHARSREQEEIGMNQMKVLLPPGALEALKPTPRAAPVPHEAVKVDPRVIRKVAPAIEPPPPPTPPPVQPKKELPNAPVPQPNAAAPTPPPQGAKGELPKQQAMLQHPDMPVPQRGLDLPKQQSPGDAIRDAARSTGRISSPLPIGGGSPMPGVQGGGGSARAGAGIGPELLTDPQGVDFNDYLRRVYITVKQNWFAVMPASVQLGDQGVVSLQFKIMRDGSVPDGDPQRVFGSGKEPLDRAAVSSIRASNPFPQLPSQFPGPYIELRFTYYYNLPVPTH